MFSSFLCRPRKLSHMFFGFVARQAKLTSNYSPWTSCLKTFRAKAAAPCGRQTLSLVTFAIVQIFVYVSCAAVKEAFGQDTTSTAVQGAIAIDSGVVRNDGHVTFTTVFAQPPSVSLSGVTKEIDEAFHRSNCTASATNVSINGFDYTCTCTQSSSSCISTWVAASQP
jgi:hypothetical protein